MKSLSPISSTVANINERREDMNYSFGRGSHCHVHGQLKRIYAPIERKVYMKKDRYIYPAIFDNGSDGISVEFPDLPGCFTCGDTEEEALQMAKEALALHLYGLEQENEVIPEPSKLSGIPYKNNKTVVFIEVWMPTFRYKMEKKVLTIPQRFDHLFVNNSQILQDA